MIFKITPYNRTQCVFYFSVCQYKWDSFSMSGRRRAAEYCLRKNNILSKKDDLINIYLHNSGIKYGYTIFRNEIPIATMQCLTK